MNQQAATSAIRDLADAAQSVLDAATPVLPAELLEPLAAAIGRTRTMLPPHLFCEAVEQAPIAISITDPEANILYVNPEFERVTGYSRGDIVGQNESLLSDKTTPVQVYADLWRHLTAGRTWNGNLVNRRRDGTRYLAEILIAPVLDRSGLLRHYLGVHRDVTEVHRLQRQVLNQKNLIETMVGVAPVVFALLDEAGRVILDNDAHQALGEEIGRAPAGVILELLTPAKGESFSDREVSFAARDDGPPRWFTCAGTWIREMGEGADSFFAADDRRFLLLVAQEVTHLKQQQEEMRRSALRALVAEEARVQGMREAISAAEFQLQVPFNMLKAALTLLERRGAPAPSVPLVGALKQALGAGQETLELLRKAMPRGRSEPSVRLNINQLLRDALSLNTERMLALGVQVDWRPAEQLPMVRGHENRLRASFKQLIDNALDAMESPSVPLRELRVRTEPAGDGVRVVIEDSGPGVPDALRLKVFEPFFTTRESGSHVGVGLSMVQEVVNQHAGAMTLGRGEAGGCRVELSLPVREPRAPLGPRSEGSVQ